MKKFIAAAAVTALALTLTPTAAAQGSSAFGSSSAVAPNPTPDPNFVYYDVWQVVDLIVEGYEQHYTNRGYTIHYTASDLAQTYATATPSQRNYIRAEAAASGIDIHVETFPTSTYETKYQELINTPYESYKAQLVGAYVQVNQQTVTATIVTAR
ncbi:hypothetical protein COCCU_06110 [Corynebacterium occultum]|uniref:Uncharacterized protein n=1 Tax=Corynebacterium occultum TaxID=2675219 RepID=A0A6B8W8E4_9CORY|nr:hypothetical protein [Corynebacterium occultum]QGU07166.1 hypothetical protein COCCU_06110 [Corynebacterium occultum]